MQSHRARYRAVMVAAATLLLVVGASSKPKTPRKPFSYDPLCRHGRLSDGEGYVLRCLTEKEARALRDAEERPAEPGPEPESPPAAFDVVLGPIRADQGAFPKGVESLNKGMPKYRACVEKHGPPSAARATVEVRFLVRGRGRAEGAVVKKQSGMNAELAKCIADVVDRRFVGYPDDEMVGATLVVTVESR